MILPGLIRWSWSVLRCLRRLLLTLKPLSQTQQTYGLSPVCVRLWISMEAIDGKVLEQDGQVARGDFLPDLKSLLRASCCSVCDPWMWRTHSAGEVKTSWHNSHRSVGYSSSSPSSLSVWKFNAIIPNHYQLKQLAPVSTKKIK